MYLAHGELKRNIIVITSNSLMHYVQVQCSAMQLLVLCRQAKSWGALLGLRHPQMLLQASEPMPTFQPKHRRSQLRYEPHLQHDTVSGDSKTNW